MSEQSYTLFEVMTQVDQRGHTLEEIVELLKPNGKIYNILINDDKNLIDRLYKKNPEEFAFELEKLNQPENTVNVLSGFNYEHGKVVYKIKIENNTDTHIAEISIVPFIPKNIFIIDFKEKNIPLIKSGEAQTVTFQLRPKGECGNVSISGQVTYFDTLKNQHEKINLKPKETAIICPMLKIVELNEKEWRSRMTHMIKVEESTEEIPIKAENLSKIISNALQDLNMYMLEPNIIKDEMMFNSITRFYCEGIKGLPYATQIEIIGGMKNSKLILKAYAKNQESLIGFYHCILDEIQKRTNVKQYLTDTLVIQNIQEYISGEKIDIRDSVIQRSKIGSEIKNKKASKS